MHFVLAALLRDRSSTQFRRKEGAPHVLAALLRDSSSTSIPPTGENHALRVLAALLRDSSSTLTIRSARCGTLF